MMSALEKHQSKSDRGLHEIEIRQFSMSDKYFYPIQARSEIVNAFPTIIEIELNKLKESSRSHIFSAKYNLTKAEYLALQGMKDRKDITICQANKGSLVVVLDADSYKAEALRQLTDANTYHAINADATMAIKQKPSHLFPEIWK